jgi:hypothetical protein
VPWHTYLENVLPVDENGIILVVKYTCDGLKKPEQQFTYQINGPDVVFLGAGDLHAHPRWSPNEFSAQVDAFLAAGNCVYSMHVFPSDEFHSTYTGNTPAIYTSIVVLIFFVITLVFTW